MLELIHGAVKQFLPLYVDSAQGLFDYVSTLFQKDHGWSWWNEWFALVFSR